MPWGSNKYEYCRICLPPFPTSSSLTLCLSCTSVPYPYTLAASSSLTLPRVCYAQVFGGNLCEGRAQRIMLAKSSSIFEILVS